MNVLRDVMGCVQLPILIVSCLFVSLPCLREAAQPLSRTRVAF